MTYSEILAAVISETNRPDLPTEIANAISRSTLKMHGLELWKFDLVFAPLAIVVPSFLMTIDTSTSLVRYRQISFIKAYDPNYSTDPFAEQYNGASLPWYEPADVNRLMDVYGKNVQNVHYQVGRIIHVRSSVAPSGLYVGYYQRPNTDPSNYVSWIADEYPWAIIDDAVTQIFKTVGLEDKMKARAAMVAEHIQILKTNYLEEEGR